MKPMIVFFAALLMASGCAVQRDISAFEPVERAKVVRAKSVESLIGKTIIVAWNERVEVCSAGRCESNESTHNERIAIGLDGAEFLSDDGSAPAEGARSKVFVQGGRVLAVAWLDRFDAQNRSRTIYTVHGDTCSVAKPDTLRSSGSAGQTQRFEVELLSCEVRSGPYSP